MITGLLLSLALMPQETSNLTLSRGCGVPGLSTRYWAVEDTVLSSRAPNRNLGGALFLEPDDRANLLIRFGDLNRAIGHRKVRSASLRLTLGGTGMPILRRVSRVLASWGEGPIVTSVAIFQPAAAEKSEAEAFGSATWSMRHLGVPGAKWQMGGAAGRSDASPIADAKLSPGGSGQVLIEGLGEAIQYQLDRPAENFGFLLEFDGPTQFFSSQSNSDRPALELVLENAPRKLGPDLSVQLITQSPSYERFAKPESATAQQDGVSVDVPRSIANLAAQHWPKDDEPVTYTATIRNIGSAPVSRFSVRWSALGVPGSESETQKSLAPGEATAVTLTRPYRMAPFDHRVRTVACQVSTPDDVDLGNNCLTIPENGLSLGFVVAESFAKSFGGPDAPMGLACVEDWVQAHAQFLNESAFPQSRFSFARTGIREAVRVQEIEIVSDSQFDSAHLAMRNNLKLDGAIGIGPADRVDARDVDRAVLKRIGASVGLVPDLTAFPNSGVTPGWLAAMGPDGPLVRGTKDLYPGLMGYGDTRNEALLSDKLVLPYDPVQDPLIAFVTMEVTDLFCATDAAALNAMLGQRRGEGSTWLHKAPSLMFISSRSLSDEPVAPAKLDFFQLAGGKVSDQTPAFSTQVDASGLALLPKRATGLAEGAKSPGGQSLSASPFGRIALDGGNAMFLVRATKDGSVGYGILKLWQVLDCVSRNPVAPVVLPIRFDMGTQAADLGVELAKGKIITDSGGSLPARLSAALDGDPSTSTQLTGKKDAWIEIDLGRDRLIAEIGITARGDFWRSFEISGYATGQTPSEGEVFARELDFRWSSENRGMGGGSGVQTVPYRFKTRRARYLRIRCQKETELCALYEVRVHPPKAP
ncbi:MAG: discoidin domain-containing protein [Armatimonadetes bacterium]|nr:discoidin domain-containing protein [Armatimonadota bacterium]